MHRRESANNPGKFIESDLINAVDFALPLGTPVQVAREGRVRDFWLNSDWFYEGLDPEIGNNPPIMSTNFVIVEHGDGTETWYSHLSKQRFVQRDQVVSRGDIVGVTGRSGWIGQIPHLHFHVFEVLREKGIEFRTIPMTFQDYSGSLDHETLLREGNIYLG